LWLKKSCARALQSASLDYRVRLNYAIMRN
jgi:hypothetical protein